MPTRIQNLHSWLKRLCFCRYKNTFLLDHYSNFVCYKLYYSFLIPRLLFLSRLRLTARKKTPTSGLRITAIGRPVAEISIPSLAPSPNIFHFGCCSSYIKLCFSKFLLDPDI